MKIGILGGGIGGLSSAIALKLEGFEVDVYERHTSPAEIGAGIGRQLASSIFNKDIEFCKQRNRVSKSIYYQSAVVGMAKGWARDLPINI